MQNVIVDSTPRDWRRECLDRLQVFPVDKFRFSCLNEVSHMARITVIGGGYVGLVTSACFAELGHTVRCLEADPNKVTLLRRGEMPIREPGLSDIWTRQIAAGRLTITDDPSEAISLANFIFVTVGTPEKQDGSADLSFVESAVKTALKHSDLSRTICIKSTVPPGTSARLQELVNAGTDRSQGWSVVSNPEFLSQGRAVQDFLNPDRIVVGSNNVNVSRMVANLYSSLNSPVVVVDSTAAELVKYASNSFLALKISFINEISRLCEHSGTDVGLVATGVGMDNRIGPSFLEAGIGWGGSCFPKDTAALEQIMKRAGVDSPVVSAARTVNASQVSHIVKRLDSLIADEPGTSVAVLGLTFKEGTDDLRGSQVIPLINRLLDSGHEVRVFDPLHPKLDQELAQRVTMCESATEAVLGASAAVLATAWPELISMDYAAVGQLMKSRVLVDARRALDPEVMRHLGFEYYRPGDGRAEQPVVHWSSQPVPLAAA